MFRPNPVLNLLNQFITKHKSRILMQEGPKQTQPYFEICQISSIQPIH